MKQLWMAIAFVLLAAPAWAVEEVPMTSAPRNELYDELTGEMACLCGCGTTLKTCPHEDCPFAIPARGELKAMTDAGLSRQEVVDKMVRSRGEAVLAAPTFSGFNIMAWVMPFIAILTVGGLVALILKKWSGRKPASPAQPPAASTQGKEDNDPYLKKMRDELDKYEE